ncbi:hypothetical protein FKM82_021756, partial [Ascaphus truei]
DIRPCSSSPCLNGGICEDLGVSYSCACTQGFTGMHCESEVRPCSSSPCLNGGICEDLDARYSCVCTRAFTGTHCEIGEVLTGIVLFTCAHWQQGRSKGRKGVAQVRSVEGQM